MSQRVARAGLLSGPQDPQVLKEVMLFVDRAAITEELVRLAGHLKHAEELLRARKPVGRPLDFLCQELFESGHFPDSRMQPERKVA